MYKMYALRCFHDKCHGEISIAWSVHSFHLWLGVDDTPQANAIQQRHVTPLSARTWSPEQYDTHDW